MLIDTHSHIYAEEFMNESEEVVQRAFDAGIRKIILPNIDSSSIGPMLNLSDSFPNNCFPTIGLHPTSVNEDFQKELDIMEYWLKKRNFCAVGEIGMDLYWDKTFLEERLNSLPGEHSQVLRQINHNLEQLCQKHQDYREQEQKYRRRESWIFWGVIFGCLVLFVCLFIASR